MIEYFLLMLALKYRNAFDLPKEPALPEDHADSPYPALWLTPAEEQENAARGKRAFGKPDLRIVK